MKKVLSIFLVFALTLMIVGITKPNVDVQADMAAPDLIPGDYDTDLPDDVVIRFDAAYGLQAWANEYTATALDATSDGGYLVAGSVTTDGWSWIRGEIIKYNADYTVDYTISLEDDWWTYITAIMEDSNGDIWIFTSREDIDDNGTPEDDSDDIWTYPRVIAKIDGTTHAVVDTYDSAADLGVDWATQWDHNSIIELSNGNILVTSVQSGDLLYEIIDPSDMSLVTSGTYGSTSGNDMIANIKAVADPTDGFYLTAGIGAIDGFFTGSGLTMKGDQDTMVTKFNNAGVEQWTTQMGSTGGWNYGIALDYHDGHVYVAGETWGTKDQDFAGLTDNGGSDAFVAKLDAATGAVQWVKSHGGAGYEAFADLAVNADGVFLGGVATTNQWTNLDATNNVATGDLDYHQGTVEGNLVVKFGLDGTLKASAVHNSRFDYGDFSVGIYGVELNTAGEMVYAAGMGYWANLAGTHDSNEHNYWNNSYNFDNPLNIGTWGAFNAGTAVVYFGDDTTVPVITAPAKLVVPTEFGGMLYHEINDNVTNSNRMDVGYTGTLDLMTAGVYNITLNTFDIHGNEGTFAQEVTVYDELNGLMLGSETVVAEIPDLLMVVDDAFDCTTGVTLTLTGETFTTECNVPDMTAVGNYTVDYVFTSANYELHASREVKVVDSPVYNLDDAGVYFVAQTVEIPFGYTATLDTVAIDNGHVVGTDGTYVLEITDGTNTESITFEIKIIATGVEDGGFYAGSTTINFIAEFTATLNGDPFTSGTEITQYGKYEIVFTEVADNSNTITFNFVVGDALFKDLFEHGVIQGTEYLVNGNVTRINGSDATSDGGFVVVGDRDGAMYMAKFDAAGALEFEQTWASTGGDDVLADVTEVAPGRYAAIGSIYYLDGDFTGSSLNQYLNGEEAWYSLRILLDVHWDGTDVTWDAFNGTDKENGVVAGSENYRLTARIEYDDVDEVLYIMHVIDQWSFDINEDYGSHDLYLAQYTVDADSFDFAWYRTFGSTDWDRIGRMDGYAAPLAVVPGEGVVTGYASKQADGTPVTEVAKLLASATPWYDDGAGGAYESAVVIRVADDGTTNWIKTIAGNDAVFFLDVEVDAAGNIYVAGAHHSNVEPDVWAPYGDFGVDVDNADDGSYTGNRDNFVAKLDPNGETLWLEVAGTPGNDELKDIIVDADGNVYMFGYTDGVLAAGGDTPVAARAENIRTFVGKITADGVLVGFENYNSLENTIFNSSVILDDGTLLGIGFIKVDAELTQADTDFEITDQIDGLTKYVGMIVEIEFVEDFDGPTVTSVPELIVEVGIGSLDLLNDYTDTVFENIVFDFADNYDNDYLLGYEITGTVDFDTVGDYTLSFVALDMRNNESVATDLVVHVVAEDFNTAGTNTVNSLDVVVTDMDDANLDLANDNTAFVYDAGIVTIAGETLVKAVYDLNDITFDIDTPGVYDIVEVFSNENYYIVLDRNIKLLGGLVGIEDGVTYETTVTGNFAGTATLNGVAYTSGTEITEAGNHEIVLIEVPGADPITVNFTVTSGVNLEEAEVYNRTQTPVFRGTATLNGDAFTSGTDVVTPGAYVLVITGVGGYTETVNFSLTSGINVADDAELDDETIVTFRGTGTLNGTAFTSGTEITAPGVYVLVISGVGTYSETINFTITAGVTGVIDEEEYDSGTDVQVYFNIGTATLSKDGGSAAAFTSGTIIDDDGLYVLTVSGADGYKEEYTFRIGEEPLVCSDDQEIVDGECVDKPIVCEEGFELEDGECVEVKTGCFGSISASLIFITSILGGGVLYLLRKKPYIK